MKNLRLSLKAHRRLAKKNKELQVKDKANYDKYFIKGSYHSKVANLQEKQNRVLSRKEKEKVYSDVVSTFY